jgi:hypothetical protein
MLPNGVPEMVTYLTNCVGNFIRVVPWDYVCPADMCETCGDFVCSKRRVVLVRADVDSPKDYEYVDPSSVGLTFRSIVTLDKMVDAGMTVMVVPTGFDVENIDTSWGMPCR